MKEKTFASLVVKIWRIRQQIDLGKRRLKEMKKIATSNNPDARQWIKDFPVMVAPLQKELNALCRKLAA